MKQRVAGRSVMVLLMAAVLFFAAGILNAAFGAAHAEAGGGTGGRYTLAFDRILANEIGGVSYDLTFSVTSNESNGPFFTNSVATENNIILEADTVASEFEKVSEDAVYGLVRAKTNSQTEYIYTYGGELGNSTLYSASGTAGGNVNMFQAGKKTYVKYEVGTGPSITVGGEAYGNGSSIIGDQYSWSALDEAEARYFGFGTNGGVNYSGSLTNFRVYDEATMQDLGIYFSHGFTSSVTRYGTAGERITVTPVAGGELKVSGISAVGEDGQPVEIEGFTDNGDGSVSFTMPAQNVTVSPVYSYEGHYRIYSELDSETGVQLKLDNASYVVSFGWNNAGWFTNAVETASSITMQYTTAYVSGDVNTRVYGALRAKSPVANDAPDNEYGYIGQAWYTFGTMLHEVGQETVISYDVSQHAFTFKVGDTALSASQHPAGYTGDMAAFDADGATSIGLAWNEGVYSAALYDFKMMDAGGWDLGILANTKYQTLEFVNDLYGTAGEPITLRLTDREASLKEIAVRSSDGSYIQVTDNKDGSYTFTMPDGDVYIEPVTFVDNAPYYGGYRLAGTNNYIFIGEQSYIVENGVRTDCIVTIDSNGGFEYQTDSASAEGTISASGIVIGSDTYAPDDDAPVITTSAENASVKEAEYSFTVSVDEGTYTVMVNNALIETEDDGSYTITLAEGRNDIVISAEDPVGHTSTRAVRITLDTTAPVITTSAQSGTVSESAYTFTVSVNEGTFTVTLNGEALQGDGGNFEAALVSGENTIEITAADELGNSSSQRITVTYAVSEEPAPGPGEEEEGGCSGSAAGVSLIAASAVLAAAAWLLRRRSAR